MKVKLVASDLDGTIIDKNNNISAKNFNAIKKILILQFVLEKLTLYQRKYVINLLLLMEFLEMELKL